ncbi:MAG TPA: ABC transporter ATP-binding protein [Chitinophagales bacterium]|nr:ABC transporter ATP-binding protein [Chitinophagales bacterium]
MSLILSNVEKSFGDHLIFEIDHFQFDPGAYWMLGTNGAGKTTLLKTIGGMLPFQGEVMWNNFSLKENRRNYLRQVSYAPAEPLYPQFVSGRELINFYAECRSGEADHVKELLSVSGVEKFADGKTGTYSTGMLKKLSIVLAFIGRPSVLLLDEPLITIDKGSVHFIYDLMHDFLNQQHGVLIFTSHQTPVETDLPGLKKVNLMDEKLTEV